MAKDKPFLDVQNLTKTFGALVLFEDISFSIAEGQRVGLIAKTGRASRRCSRCSRARRGATPAR